MPKVKLPNSKRWMLDCSLRDSRPKKKSMNNSNLIDADDSKNVLSIEDKSDDEEKNGEEEEEKFHHCLPLPLLR